MKHQVRFQIQLGGGLFDHVEVCIFLAFGGTFGLPQEPPEEWDLLQHNIWDVYLKLNVISKKKNGSKKSQSLGSDVKCHITLRRVKTDKI